MSAPRIDKKITHGTWCGKSFSVEVWQPEGGRAFVRSVEIEGLPPFHTPDDIDDADTMTQAEANGIRFATSMIDN